MQNQLECDVRNEVSFLSLSYPWTSIDDADSEELPVVDIVD